MSESSSAMRMFGVLNVNKPPKLTSRDVVNRVQRLIRPDKCGHAGTLDPLATGVLLLCVGPATRLVSLLQQTQKTYVSRFQLGVTSDTDDSTGMIVEQKLQRSKPSVGEVEEALALQVGVIQQVPPTYSAVHVAGRRAYKLARAGATPTLTPRPVEVFSITVLDYSWPQLDLQIECGSGTYIRAIARDLGQSLGCGALMTDLCRTRVGAFDLESAVACDFETAGQVCERLTSATQIVAGLPQHRCTIDEAEHVMQGRPVSCPAATAAQLEAETQSARQTQCALLSSDGSQLLGIAEYRVRDGRNLLQPRSVFRLTR